MVVFTTQRCPAKTNFGTHCKKRGEHKWQGRMLCSQHHEMAKLEPLEYVDQEPDNAHINKPGS